MPMLSLPLHGPRLLLRDFTPADLPAYQALRAAPGFGPLYAAHELSADFSASLLHRFMAQQHAQPRRHWQLAICLAHSGELIGSVGVRLLNMAGEASFGIELAITHRDQGLATEASRLLLDAAFNQLGLHRMEADTHAANLTMQSLAARLGFVSSQREGERLKLALGVGLTGAQSQWRLMGSAAWLARLDSCWQLQHRQRPDFYFGNALLLDAAPADRTIWEDRFAAAFAHQPRIRHRTLIWAQEADDCAERYAAWTDKGYHYNEDVALVLTQDSFLPVAASPDLFIRPLQSDADWADWTALMLATRDPAHEEADYRGFLSGCIEDYRTLAAAGHGQTWGAFADGQLLAIAGLYTWHTLGRFQLVATAERARRRGIASALISHLAAWGLVRVPQLVIVADAHYHAIGLYRQLGFVDASREASLCWWPESGQVK